MTGLRVVEVNVYVQRLCLKPRTRAGSRADKRKEKAKEKEKEKEALPVTAEVVEPEPPRVK
jgi:uncharacterized alkaline shock family protein YloU